MNGSERRGGGEAILAISRRLNREIERLLFVCSCPFMSWPNRQRGRLLGFPRWKIQGNMGMVGPGDELPEEEKKLYVLYLRGEF